MIRALFIKLINNVFIIVLMILCFLYDFLRSDKCTDNKI